MILTLYERLGIDRKIARFADPDMQYVISNSNNITSSVFVSHRSLHFGELERVVDEYTSKKEIDDAAVKELEQQVGLILYMYSVFCMYVCLSSNFLPSCRP